MVYIGGGFKVFVHCGKVVERITDRYQPGNLGLAGFLNNYKLFYRVIYYEPYMGVSIEILHDLCPIG
jgi:hypothetical protein